MSEPCFKCGVARSCRHRTVEPIDRSHVRAGVDRRTIDGRIAAALKQETPHG